MSGRSATAGSVPAQPARGPLVFLCTGNATRSVLAGAALHARRPDLPVVTAGTLVVEGQPASVRTRAAFEAVGLPLPAHRSRQATGALLGPALLVVGLAPEHVAWVRRTHPEVAARTATLRRLCHGGDGGGEAVAAPGDGLVPPGLADVALEPWEEVADPGGLEVDAYVRCAHEVVELVHRLADRLDAVLPPGAADLSAPAPGPAPGPATPTPDR